MNMSSIIALVLVIIVILMWVWHKRGGTATENFAYSDPRIKPGPKYSTWIDPKFIQSTWPGPPETVVGFHFTNWCGFCKSMKPIWERVKKRLSTPGSKIKFVENDEEKNSTPSIDSVPAIIMYRDGVMHKYDGTQDEEKLIQWILTVTHERNYLFPLK